MASEIQMSVSPSFSHCLDGHCGCFHIIYSQKACRGGEQGCAYAGVWMSVPQHVCVGDPWRSGFAGHVHLGSLAGPALMPSGLFCSPPQERKVGFSRAHSVPSLRRALCWPSPSSGRRWRKSDATCGTRKSTPRSTAGSQ